MWQSRSAALSAALILSASHHQHVSPIASLSNSHHRPFAEPRRAKQHKKTRMFFTITDHDHFFLIFIPSLTMKFSPLALVAASAAISSPTSAFVVPSIHHESNILSTSTTLFESQELWRVERVDQISDWLTNGSTPKSYANPLSLKENVPNSWFVEQNAAVAAKVDVDLQETIDDSCSLDDYDEEAQEPMVECGDRGLNSEAFILAGPRKEIAFDPKECKAAIVTCGGLCPGLNTVVREVVMCLRRQYGVTETLGVPAGYRGFKDPSTWRDLDEKAVANLHNIGGSTLGSSRGGHDTEAIVDSLVEQGVNLLFVVGGDGTVRGAAKIAEEVKKRGLAIAVAVVPKTIDNDVPLLGKCLCGILFFYHETFAAVSFLMQCLDSFPSLIYILLIIQTVLLDLKPPLRLLERLSTSRRRKLRDFRSDWA